MNPLNHVAIIMDGNGRWGLKYKGSRNAGHKEGLKTVEKVIKVTIKNNIKFLTPYIYSKVINSIKNIESAEHKNRNWQRKDIQNLIGQILITVFHHQNTNLMKLSWKEWTLEL